MERLLLSGGSMALRPSTALRASRGLPPLALAGSIFLAALAACSASEDANELKAHGNGGTDGSPSAPVGDGTTDPVDLPVVHLTSAQYARTVADLLAPIAVTLPGVPVESPGVNYDSAARSQPLGAEHIEAYQTNAIAAAAAAVSHLDTLLGCTPASPSDETSCITSFVARFAKRAYRRPLTSAEQDDLVGFFTTVRQADDFPTSVGLLVQAILESPSFLYRIERGEPNPSGPNVQLTSYEVASRLSFFLWNTMPDAALFDAADKNALKETPAVEAEARRMLADPRAHAAIANFHSAWLRFDRMANLDKDPTLFPGFDAATQTALREGVAKYVDGIFFTDGSLRTLLTDTHAWVNDATAPLYGESAQGSDLRLIPVNPQQRAGILTNAGWLAGLAHTKESAPVLRGVTVLDRILCQPPPPPDLKNVTPPAIDPNKPMTTRARLETQHAVAGCAGCHRSIDGIGFAFESYDATGAYRTMDNGFPVDATGSYANVPFDGALELTKRLAEDPNVHACVASHWMRYARGLDASDITAKNVASVTKKFESANLDARELLVALVTSDLFRMRVVSP